MFEAAAGVIGIILNLCYSTFVIFILSFYERYVFD